MKNIVCLLFFSVIFANASAAAAQTAPPAAASIIGSPRKARQEPSLKDNLNRAQKFRSLAGKFEIALAPDISGFAALTPRRLGFDASGSSFDWRFKEGAANIMFYDFLGDAPAETETGRRNFFAGFRDGTLKELNAKLVAEKPLKLGDNDGWQIEFEAADRVKGVRRMFLAGKRAYSLLIVFDSKIAGTEASAAAVLDSFKLVDQSEVDRIVQQQIEAATPQPLPQTPVVARPTSDAEDDNLKGRVKQIVEEVEDLSGTFTAQGRQMSAIVDYNEAGDQTERVSYNAGKVFQITVYGYINGKRVSSSNIVRDENGPPPIMVVGTAKTTKTKPDPRYEYAYEYKYANGKLAEMRMIFNDGAPGMRYVYNRKNNETTKLVYDDEGNLNQKYVFIVDKDGNEIEKTDVGLEGSPYGTRKYSYAYELDNAGNWTKKTVFQIGEGSSKPIPYYVSYRRIAYY